MYVTPDFLSLPAGTGPDWHLYRGGAPVAYAGPIWDAGPRPSVRFRTLFNPADEVQYVRIVGPPIPLVGGQTLQDFDLPAPFP